MDGLKATEVPTDLREIPRIEVMEAKSSARRRPLAAPWAWFAALIGPAVMAVGIAVEPAPANPNAPATLLESVLGLALLASFACAALTGIRRLPQALTWAAAGAGLLITASVLCPVTAHHTSIGGWWFVQLGAAGAALAAALIGRAKRPTVSA